MKKILFLLFFVSIQVYSQNNTFPSNGNVGIGTISPTQRLEVRKDSAAVTGILVRNTSALAGAFAQYQAIGSAGKGAWFGIANDGNAGLGTFQSGFAYLSSNNLSSGLNIGADASSGILRFFTGGTGASNERVRIDNNGNIGIGTTIPTNKLEIIDNIGVTFRSSQIPNTAQYFRVFGGAYSGNKTSLIINNSTLTDNFLQFGGGTSLAEPASKILFFTGSVGTTSVGVERLRIDNNGNVGIGTISPTQKLDVVGNGMKVTNPTSSAYFYLEGNGSTNYAGSYLFLKAGAIKAADTFNQVRFDVNRGTDSTANFQLARSKDGVYQGYFYRYDDLGGHRFSTVANRQATNTSEVLTIRSNGNVGVGTVSPNTLLHLKSASTSMLTIEGDNTDFGNAFTLYRANNGTNQRALGMFMFDNGGQNEWFIGRPYAGSDAFVINRKGNIISHSNSVSSLTDGSGASNDVARMFTINNSGKIGIGVSNPLEKLHIGGIGTQRILVESTNSNDAVLSLRTPSQIWEVDVDGNNSSGIQPNSFLINESADGSNTRLFIAPGGNIGIGTKVVPNGYKVAIGGNLIVEKVKVKKRDTNGTWPDFVFAPTYKLPTLTEVESFVKQNSHLPEIPSAKEIETEGQDLGEMNRLLLKKVEELTLYLIEQNKEIKNLKSKVVEGNTKKTFP